MSESENQHYKNFIAFLNQPTALVGTQQLNAAEKLFESANWTIPYWLSGDSNIVSAQCVHNTEDDESSMPVSVVWKIVFKAGTNFWHKTGWNEKTVYFSFDGYNRSHEGRTYESWREVTPKTKTVEVFE